MKSKFAPSKNYVNGTFTVDGNIVCTGNVSGSSISPSGGGGGTPGGADTNVQFNDASAFGGDADFTWDKTGNVLNVTGIVSASAIAISGTILDQTAFQVSTPNSPNLFNIDASSSIDGGSRVIIRNSNDDFIDPQGTDNRGVLHIEQNSGEVDDVQARGLTMFTYPPAQFASEISLHTWNTSSDEERGSEINLISQQDPYPDGVVVDNQKLGQLQFGGYSNNGVRYGAKIEARAVEGWTFSSVNAAELRYYLIPKGKGYVGGHYRERIRMTDEGHLIVFPYSASNDDALALDTNYDSAPGAPAIQIYGPTLFGSSSASTHTFTGSVNINGDLSASINVSASAFYGDGSNLTGLARDYGPLAADPPGESPSYTEDFESTATGSLPTDWTSFGDATWIVSASNPHGGTKCCISQVISDSQSTSLVYTASLATPATVTFWWDVSSESGWDFLKFYVDEVKKAEISGTPGYAQYSFSLPAGTSALRWEYMKDSGVSAGLDQGYVDDFEITPIAWSAGDLYYNTVLNMTMHYDASRLKWLSQETAEIPFGGGSTAPGVYFTGSAGVAYSDEIGRYTEYKGTVVSLTWTRSNFLTASSVEVTSGGTTITSVSVPVMFPARSSSLDLNDDIPANIVLGVRNTAVLPTGSIEDAMGIVRIKWKV